MRVSVVLLAALSCMACASAGNTADQGTTSTDEVSIKLLAGEWDPQSRNYEGSPGRFVVEGASWTSGSCTRPLEVVRSAARKDTGWKGSEQSDETRKYTDTFVQVQSNPTCGGLSEKFVRFLIAEDSPCRAYLMIYSSRDEMDQDRFGSWGSYANLTCLARAK